MLGRFPGRKYTFTVGRRDGDRERLVTPARDGVASGEARALGDVAHDATE